MYSLHSFPSGLRLLTSPLKNTEAVTVLVLAGAGSRHEKKAQNGISHFLEHMFFKGAQKYPDTKAVAEAVDNIGGDFNAFTGKEYAGYFVKTAAAHADIACDVLSDMLLHARFDEKEIEKERGVILEEYNMYLDTPMYQIGWDFEKLLFGDQPIGWDQIGTAELIKSIQREDFLQYKERLYVPANIVIIMSGNITEKKAIGLAEKFFLRPHEQKKPAPLKFPAYQPCSSDARIKLQNKKTEQGHLVVGVEGVSAVSDEHYTAKVLAVILGGNMSSRMFLNIREAKGLAYYIHTTTDDYLDTGVVSTRAGVDIKRADQAAIAIKEEYFKLAEKGVSPAELKKAQEYIKGKMILRLEDSEEVAHLLGQQELLYPEVHTPEEIRQEIDKITPDDIQKLAQKLFQPERLRIAAIGPFEGEEYFEKTLG